MDVGKNIEEDHLQRMSPEERTAAQQEPDNDEGEDDDKDECEEWERLFSLISLLRFSGIPISSPFSFARAFLFQTCSSNILGSVSFLGGFLD